MRTCISIMLMAIYGCAPTETDSVAMDVISKMQISYDSLMARKDTASQRLALKCKYFLDESIKDQFNTLKIITVANNYYKLQKQTEEELIKSKNEFEVVKISKQNMIDSLHKVNQLYAVANSKVVREQKENENLRKKIALPHITDVTVKCYRFKRNGKIKIETPYANQIKRIEIDYIVPANEFIEKRNYTFTFKISPDILDKGYAFKLIGDEVNDTPLKFDIIDKLKPGDYAVTIAIDGRLEYSSKLVLQ